MHDHTARTRVTMRNGVGYLVLEDIDTVAAALKGERAEFTSVTGQAAFPPERLIVTSSDVSTVQECSAESWVWQKRASELHYARQLAESPQDRVAATLERALAGDD